MLYGLNVQYWNGPPNHGPPNHVIRPIENGTEKVFKRTGNAQDERKNECYTKHGEMLLTSMAANKFNIKLTLT